MRTREGAREGDLVARDETQDEAQDEAQDDAGFAEAGPDAGVIARVRAGETGAYAELVRAHTPIALRTAALMGAGADAEDVVQDAFVKAYLALGTFKDDAAFRPWLLRIVANQTRNAVRSARRQQTAVDREGAMAGADPAIPESADPVVVALADERRARLMAALEELSEPQRWVVTYRYLLDLDEGETATALGWPRGTVKSRLSRALRRLELLLEADEAVRPGEGPGRARQARQGVQGGIGNGRGRAARRAAGARARTGGATARRPGGRPPGGRPPRGGRFGEQVMGGRRRDDGRAGARADRGDDRGDAGPRDARRPDPGGAVVAGAAGA